MNKPTYGMRVRHIRTGGIYDVFETNALVKINDEWKEAVIYVALTQDEQIDKSKPTFVRELAAFCQNFEPASEALSEASQGDKSGKH